MALTSITWFFLISSTIITIFSVIFSIIMDATFLKKKTLGSAFMLMAFGMIAIGEGFNSVAWWLGAFNAASDAVIGMLHAFFINWFAISIMYFYFFSTRNVLRDNEVIKSIISLLTGLVIGIVITFMSINAAQTINLPGQGYKFTIGGTATNLVQFAPDIALNLTLFGSLIILVLGRISVLLSAIRRRITEPLARTGSLYINISVIALTISTICLTLFLIPQINAIPGLAIILQFVRLFATFTVLLFGYLGWILPDWLKRRIRGKAWIVQYISKMEGKPLAYAFSSSVSIAKSKKEIITEVSEP